MQTSLCEIGFWDYTCPAHGSLEHHTEEDWDILLDDMCEGGFNSLVLGIKWLTTGYRSRFSWLDQEPVAAITSDNATIHYALREAKKRNIRTWLLVVGSLFNAKKFGIAPAHAPQLLGSAVYHPDDPAVAERMLALYDEVAELFGEEADGIVVEMENCDGEAPHRIPIYNAWAQKNGRPSFDEIKRIHLEPRSYPFHHWRDFTTDWRIKIFKDIETTVRSRGFLGQLASIGELASGEMAVVGNVNLERLREALPEWSLVTYDSVYDRRVNRLATMDFCIEQPHRLGIEVAYLTRGVMTWTWPPDGPPMDLEEQWQMAIEDAIRHRPETLWFMGADARSNGLGCSDVKLPRWGFEDGRAARRTLMRMAQQAGLCLALL
jgi:hypothetical protein